MIDRQCSNIWRNFGKSYYCLAPKDQLKVFSNKQNMLAIEFMKEIIVITTFKNTRQVFTYQLRQHIQFVFKIGRRQVVCIMYSRSFVHSQMILWPQISKYNYWNSMHFIYFVKSIFNESLPHRVRSQINALSM